ncbi:MAG: NADP-specific glutamate dehydrogenase [Victivallaceae bacterium]|nr:NADP-specific glutamate dehydrogenase [Victivallaceae bacterium]
MNNYAQRVYEDLQQELPWQQEFLQSVFEVFDSLSPLLDRDGRYEKHRILERITIPERIIIFQVPWVDDKENIQINRGYRVQFNSAIGPYKGGLRFHPSVNLSILKFLGFEQIFKNSLTTLPMGGGKGGSNFDPKGKSDVEIMRFCQNFMRELQSHIGPDTDVPAGDIGVGGREIGYLFGMYKKIVNAHQSVLTGKSLNFGGSLIRPEATGYGNVYFATEMLKTRKEDFENRRVMISGSGNVAQFTAQKIISEGGKVITMSDSGGSILCKDGLTPEKIEFIMNLKNINRGRISEVAKHFSDVEFFAGQKPWQLTETAVALPSATQNELDLNDAKALVKNGCVCVSEGANMPSTPDAVQYFLENQVLFGPGKAANAGGVATSGLEMTQNAMRIGWGALEVDTRLRDIMRSIHIISKNTAEEFGSGDNYVLGANIAGFRKVADAMIDLGV